MLRFIVTRLGVLIPTFIGVTIVAFMLIRLIPGDPIELLVGERSITPERHAMLRAQFGFDKPLWQQYLPYLGDLAQGDLGKSIVTRQPVLEEFLALFPATVELSLCALADRDRDRPAGGHRRRGQARLDLRPSADGRLADRLLDADLLVGAALDHLLLRQPALDAGLGPDRVLYFFEPVTGFMLIDSLLSGEEGAFASALRHLVLPAIVLGTVPLAVIARQTRSAMLEVLSEDYVRTARAKGLPPLRVVGLHALRNALIPVITVIGLQVGMLFSGAILTETIFAWPGIGKWLVDSIGRRDYPAVQGGVLLIATMVMIVNLIVDLLYGLINPRIRHAR